MTVHAKQMLLLISVFWAACCHTATAKNIVASSVGRSLEGMNINETAATLPTTAERYSREEIPLAPTELVSGAGAKGTAESNASLDASKKLAMLDENTTEASLKGSNSSTKTLKPVSLERDLQAAGSEMLRIEGRSLSSHSTDYHRPIYDYNDHGAYKDSQDYPSDRSGSDGSDHPYKGASYNGYNDDQSSTYKGGHNSEHGHSGSTGHSDDAYSAHDTKGEEGDHSRGADSQSGDTHLGSYEGGHRGGAQSEAGHDAGSRGHVNKGHSQEGFDTVHHKEEYGYSETFGDDEDLAKYHDSTEHFDDFHVSDDVKNFFGSSFMDDHSHDGYGNSGDHSRGEYHDHRDDTTALHGNEGVFGHDSSFGTSDSSAHNGGHYHTPTHYGPDFDRITSTVYDSDHHDSEHHDRDPHDSDHLNRGHHDSDHYDSDHHNSPYLDSDHHGSHPYDDTFPHSSAKASIDAKFASIVPQSFSSVDSSLGHYIPKREVGLYEAAVGDYDYHKPLFRSDVTRQVGY